jgi:cytosolic iron-sulfur protein assembly protein CIAO1
MDISAQCLLTLLGHEEDQIWCVAWTHDGNFLASCGLDRIVRIWGNFYRVGHWEDVANTGCIATLEDAQARTLRSCEWSPDGSLLATASFDGTVIIWEALNQGKTSWEQIASLEGHDSEVKSVSWNYDGSLIATCGRDKKIWIWEKLHGGEYECISVLDGHTQDVKFVKFHPRQSVLFSCSYDDTIRVWFDDGDDWYCKRTLQGHSSTVWGLAISEHSPKIVSCSDDCSLLVWECDKEDFSGDWQIQEKLPQAHAFPVYSVDWSRDHGRIISGGGDNHIAIYDKNLTLECRVSAHENDVNCVRWNPNTNRDNMFASCGDDGKIKIWTIS